MSETVMESIERLKREMEENRKVLIPKLKAGFTARVTIKEEDLGCSDVQDLYKKQGYVDIYMKGKNFYIDDTEEDENVLCVDDEKYIDMIVSKVRSFTLLDKETEEMIETVFLRGVCKNYMCGSQRCDGGHEWIEGCQLYREFKETVENKMAELLDRQVVYE